MPDLAAHVPPLTPSHISTLGSHFQGSVRELNPIFRGFLCCGCACLTLVTARPKTCPENDDTNHLLLSLSLQRFTEATTKEFLTQPIAVHRGQRARARTFAHRNPGCNMLPLPRDDAFRAALQSNVIRTVLQTARADHLLADTADATHSRIAHIQLRRRLHLI